MIFLIFVLPCDYVSKLICLQCCGDLEGCQRSGANSGREGVAHHRPGLPAVFEVYLCGIFGKRTDADTLAVLIVPRLVLTSLYQHISHQSKEVATK